MWWIYSLRTAMDWTHGGMVNASWHWRFYKTPIRWCRRSWFITKGGTNHRSLGTPDHQQTLKLERFNASSLCNKLLNHYLSGLKHQCLKQNYDNMNHSIGIISYSSMFNSQSWPKSMTQWNKTKEYKRS